MKKKGYYLELRHCAISLKTEEIICCSSSNRLKRAVARRTKLNHEFGDGGQWRFCHDYGKRWIDSEWDIH